MKYESEINNIGPNGTHYWYRIGFYSVLLIFVIVNALSYLSEVAA